jgi:hypothetical protein
LPMGLSWQSVQAAPSWRIELEVEMIRMNRNSFGAIRSLVFVALFSTVMAATPTMPALAGNGSFSTTGSMNFARDGQTARQRCSRMARCW